MTDDINDFLMGGGGKAASFEEVGVVCEGEIIDARLAQQTDMDTNAPLFWTDGRPRMQLVLTLQTEERATGPTMTASDGSTPRAATSKLPTAQGSR